MRESPLILSARETTLRSRRRNALNHNFRYVATAMTDGTVVDGEVVALGPVFPGRLRSSAELSLRAEHALGFEWAETNTQKVLKMIEFIGFQVPGCHVVCRLVHTKHQNSLTLSASEYTCVPGRLNNAPIIITADNDHVPSGEG